MEGLWDKILSQVDANDQLSQVDVGIEIEGIGLVVTRCGARLVYEQDIEDLKQNMAGSCSCSITLDEDDLDDLAKHTILKQSHDDHDGDGDGPMENLPIDDAEKITTTKLTPYLEGLASGFCSQCPISKAQCEKLLAFLNSRTTRTGTALGDTHHAANASISCMATGAGGVSGEGSGLIGSSSQSQVNTYPVFNPTLMSAQQNASLHQGEVHSANQISSQLQDNQGIDQTTAMIMIEAMPHYDQILEYSIGLESYAKPCGSRLCYRV
nr:hypothetical protein CFP56_36993 [Quercus suber]